jgi:hypothetical protein
MVGNTRHAEIHRSALKYRLVVFVTLLIAVFVPPAVANSVEATALVVKPIPLNTINWSGSAGFGSVAPGWYRDTSGIVHFEGAITRVSTGGTDPNLIGTLPAIARPARSVFTIVHTFNGTYADLSINTSGQIAVIDPRPPAVTDFTFVSLEGITYNP